jgi:hypothetical protein
MKHRWYSSCLLGLSALPLGSSSNSANNNNNNNNWQPSSRTNNYQQQEDPIQHNNRGRRKLNNNNNAAGGRGRDGDYYYRNENSREADYSSSNRDDYRNPYASSSSSPLPPPPPPPGSSYQPIHYSFKASATSSKDDKDVDDETLRNNNSPNDFASSPRRDAITLQTSTRRGRFSLSCACLTVGMGCGYYFGQSLSLQQPKHMAIAMGVVFVFGSFLRNDYGELIRVLGLTLLWTLRRFHTIRKEYPTWPYIIAACCQLNPASRRRRRRYFPPGTSDTVSPWNYVATAGNDDGDDDDNNIEFNMIWTMLAMSLVGALCGSSLPVLPTWMGALLGAASLSMAITLSSSQGDLTRVMGARVVAVGREVWSIHTELQLWSKVGRVSSKILDKLMILDRKHKVRDRVGSGVTFLYNQVLKATAGNREGQVEEENEDPRQRQRQQRQGEGGNNRDRESRQRRPYDDDDDYEPYRDRNDSASSQRSSRRGPPPPRRPDAAADRDWAPPRR